jgi:uncharacterized protein (TIGR02246 family)
MRSLSIVAAVAGILAVVCFVTADDKPATKPGTKAAGKTAVSQPTATPAAVAAAIADEESIRKRAAAYAKSYGEGNAAAVAGHFTADAEYVTDEGDVLRGREAIERALAESFQETPGQKLDVKIESIRFIGPGLAVEDGTAVVNSAKGEVASRSHYTAVLQKNDGQWLLASVRDLPPEGRRQHAEQLKSLDWMLGEWIDEAHESVISFSCRPSDNGTFLLRDFSVKISGEEAMQGSQRIGWDALAGQFRAWTFDSEGGYSEGMWYRDGESWLLTSSGVNADGESTSATSVFTPVNRHTMTWRAIDLVIGGVRLPDTELVQIVRRPPRPKPAAAP